MGAVGEQVSSRGKETIKKVTAKFADKYVLLCPEDGLGRLSSNVMSA